MTLIGPDGLLLKAFLVVMFVLVVRVLYVQSREPWFQPSYCEPQLRTSCMTWGCDEDAGADGWCERHSRFRQWRRELVAR